MAIVLLSSKEALKMKTFYSVKYNSWLIGASAGMMYAWFDDLEKARAFSKLN